MKRSSISSLTFYKLVSAAIFAGVVVSFVNMARAYHGADASLSQPASTVAATTPASTPAGE